jgi:hypothetical protein
MEKNNSAKTSYAYFNGADSSGMIDEAFIYENAIQNLHHEIEERQKMISALEVKIAPKAIPVAQTTLQQENEYIQNKDAVQRIKDEAVDVLIGELKTISARMRNKLNDIDERENAVNMRLIELEERQAILEEIEYVQRMIPQKMFDRQVRDSAALRKAHDIDIEKMYDNVIHKLTEKYEQLQMKTAEKERSAKEAAVRAALKEKKSVEAVKVVKPEIKAEPAKKAEAVKKLPAGQAGEPVMQKKAEQPAAAVKAEPKLTMARDIFEEGQPVKAAQVEQAAKPVVQKSVQAASAVQRAPVAAKAEPVQAMQKSETIQPVQQAKAAGAGDVKKSTAPEPKRDWRNFAYIKDSKVKLKPEDLESIKKAIVNIERGNLSPKGT